ncbi:MAG: hypothetical protein ACU85E_08740 [Gammaproteobacteria bacterium]
MKEDLKVIARLLYERLNEIKTQGYTEERLDAAMDALDELNCRLRGDVPLPSNDWNSGDLVDDGTADGD